VYFAFNTSERLPANWPAFLFFRCLCAYRTRGKNDSRWYELYTMTSSTRGTTSFDMVSKRAYAASIVLQYEVDSTSVDRNVTWEYGSGGLDDADRSLMLKFYSSTRSVFEWGLGESTRIASAFNVARYSGIDSDASYVSTCRNDSPTHFKFYFADIGDTKGWGGCQRMKNCPNKQCNIKFLPF